MSKKVSQSNSLLPINHLIDHSIENIKTMSTEESSLFGIPSGFRNLDKITGGWQLSDLIVIAASPSMGKTSLAITITNNAVIDYNIAAAYFTLEMTSQQLTNRILALNLEISYKKLMSGKLEDYEWMHLDEWTKKNQQLPLFIDATPKEISILDICTKCHDLKKKYDIQMVIVDYLHLISIGNLKADTREQEIEIICRKLKILAKELNIAVIVVSQLSRSLKNRIGSKRPVLSDLKGSGAIEQIADVVTFVYRPEQYQILEDEEGNSLKGIGEIIIAKQRNGSTDYARLKWNSEYAKFENLDDHIFTGLDDSSFFDQANNELGGDSFFSRMSNSDNDNGIDDVPF